MTLRTPCRRLYSAIQQTLCIPVSGAGTALATCLAACLTLLASSGAQSQVLPGHPQPRHTALPASVWLLTDHQHLIQIHAAHPQRALQQRPITGLRPGDELVGIDYRVARGTLYGLARSGSLYILDPHTGAARAVNPQAEVQALTSSAVGFDFNPAADRIRVVQSNSGNHRLHPDTGQAIDFDTHVSGWQADPNLRYAPNDRHAGQTPDVIASAYTYNNQDSNLTTNFVIDRRLGTLALQGSREGEHPVVSPNLGTLRTLGALGLGDLTEVSFDIADINNVAIAVVRTRTTSLPRLVRIDLQTGAGQWLGTVAGGHTVVGLAIEP